jgi:hypothetical protein
MFSKRFSKSIWVASPYHFSEIISILQRLEKEEPDVMEFWKSSPTIICDARFGFHGGVVLFSPPFHNRIVTLVTDRETSTEMMTKKLLEVLHWNQSTSV